MLELKVNIKGVVQGVGYRYSIVAAVESNSLAITGYIQNLADGSVQVHAIGDIETLKKLREILQEGSARSHVRQMDESDLRPVKKSPYEKFEIKL